MRGLARLARKACQFSLILAVKSNIYLCLDDTFSTHPGNCGVGHKASNCWKYDILRAAEDVVRAGVFEL